MTKEEFDAAKMVAMLAGTIHNSTENNFPTIDVHDQILLSREDLYDTCIANGYNVPSRRLIHGKWVSMEITDGDYWVTDYWSNSISILSLPGIWNNESKNSALLIPFRQYKKGDR